MPNYANAKIYQIISPNHPVPYIGSTTQPLSNRMTCHKKKGYNTSSRIVLDAGDAYIELIEEYPCENREQLNRREGEVIRQRECVNRRVAGQTVSEWREANRQSIRDYKNHHRRENPELYKAREKAYREANRDAINARRRANRRKAEASVDVLLQQTGKTD